MSVGRAADRLEDLRGHGRRRASGAPPESRHVPPRTRDPLGARPVHALREARVRAVHRAVHGARGHDHSVGCASPAPPTPTPQPQPTTHTRHC